MTAKDALFAEMGWAEDGIMSWMQKPINYLKNKFGSSNASKAVPSVPTDGAPSGSPQSELEKHDKRWHKYGYNGERCTLRANLAAQGFDVRGYDAKVHNFNAPEGYDYKTAEPKKEKPDEESESPTDETETPAKEDGTLPQPEKVDISGTEITVMTEDGKKIADLLARLEKEPEKVIAENKAFEGMTPEEIKEKLQEILSKLSKNPATNADAKTKEDLEKEQKAQVEATIAEGNALNDEVSSDEGKLDLLIKNHELAVANIAQQIKALNGKEPETTEKKNELVKENQKFEKEFQKIDEVAQNADGSPESPEDHAKHCKANPKSNCPFLKNAVQQGEMTEERLNQIDAESKIPKEANAESATGETARYETSWSDILFDPISDEQYEQIKQMGGYADIKQVLKDAFLHAGIADISDLTNFPEGSAKRRIAEEVIAELRDDGYEFVDDMDFEDDEGLNPEDATPNEENPAPEEGEPVESHKEEANEQRLTPNQKAALQDLVKRFGLAVSGIKEGVSDSKFNELLRSVNHFENVRNRWQKAPTSSPVRQTVRDNLAETMEEHIEESNTDAICKGIEAVLADKNVLPFAKDALRPLLDWLRDPSVSAKAKQKIIEKIGKISKQYKLDGFFFDGTAGEGTNKTPYSPENLKIFKDKYTGKLAGTDLLNPPSPQAQNSKELEETAELLSTAMANEKINMPVGELKSAKMGPAQGVLTYEVPIGFDVIRANTASNKVILSNAIDQKILSIEQGDGPNTIKITYQLKNPKTVNLADVVESEQWRNESPDMAIPNAVGLDSEGNPIVKDAAEGPHEIVTGGTGTGKSVYLQTKIAAPKLAKTPNEWKQILIDPKGTEFKGEIGSPYNWCPVQMTPQGAATVLSRLVQEMKDRASTLGINLDEYDEMTGEGASEEQTSKNLQSYNKTHRGQELPFLSLVIDEAQALSQDENFGAQITQDLATLLSQARAVGINITVASQSDRVDNVPGIWKPNLPTHTAFPAAPGDTKASAEVKSLIGKGNFIQTDKHGRRITGRACWTKDDEIRRIGDFYKGQAQGKQPDDLSETAKSSESGSDGGGSTEQSAEQIIDGIAKTEKGKAGLKAIADRLAQGNMSPFSVGGKSADSTKKMLDALGYEYTETQSADGRVTITPKPKEQAQNPKKGTQEASSDGTAAGTSEKSYISRLADELKQRIKQRIKPSEKYPLTVEDNLTKDFPVGTIVERSDGRQYIRVEGTMTNLNGDTLPKWQEHNMHEGRPPRDAKQSHALFGTSRPDEGGSRIVSMPDTGSDGKSEPASGEDKTGAGEQVTNEGDTNAERNSIDESLLGEYDTYQKYLQDSISKARNAVAQKAAQGKVSPDDYDNLHAQEEAVLARVNQWREKHGLPQITSVGADGKPVIAQKQEGDGTAAEPAKESTTEGIVKETQPATEKSEERTGNEATSESTDNPYLDKDEVSAVSGRRDRDQLEYNAAQLQKAWKDYEASTPGSPERTAANKAIDDIVKQDNALRSKLNLASRDADGNIVKSENPTAENTKEGPVTNGETLENAENGTDNEASNAEETNPYLDNSEVENVGNRFQRQALKDNADRLNDAIKEYDSAKDGASRDKALTKIEKIIAADNKRRSAMGLRLRDEEGNLMDSEESATEQSEGEDAGKSNESGNKEVKENPAAPEYDTSRLSEEERFEFETEKAHHDAAIEALKEKYRSGKIKRDAYRKQKADLEKAFEDLKKEFGFGDDDDDDTPPPPDGGHGGNDDDDNNPPPPDGGNGGAGGGDGDDNDNPPGGGDGGNGIISPDSGGKVKNDSPTTVTGKGTPNPPESSIDDEVVSGIDDSQAGAEPESGRKADAERNPETAGTTEPPEGSTTASEPTSEMQPSEIPSEQELDEKVASDPVIQGLQEKVDAAKSERARKDAQKKLDKARELLKDSMRKAATQESGVVESNQSVAKHREQTAKIREDLLDNVNDKNKASLKGVGKKHKNAIANAFNKNAEDWDEAQRNSFLKKATSYLSRNKKLSADEVAKRMGKWVRDTDRMNEEAHKIEELARKGKPISVVDGDEFAATNHIRVRDAATPKGVRAGTVGDFLAHQDESAALYPALSRKMKISLPLKDSPLTDAWSALSKQAKSLFGTSSGEGISLDQAGEYFVGEGQEPLSPDEVAERLNKEAEDYARWREGESISSIAIPEHQARAEQREIDLARAETNELFDMESMQDADEETQKRYNSVIGEVLQDGEAPKEFSAAELGNLKKDDTIQVGDSDIPMTVVHVNPKTGELIAKFDDNPLFDYEPDSMIYYKFNLNTGTKTEMMSIKGVKPAPAEAAKEVPVKGTNEEKENGTTKTDRSAEKKSDENINGNISGERGQTKTDSKESSESNGETSERGDEESSVEESPEENRGSAEIASGETAKQKPQVSPYVSAAIEKAGIKSDSAAEIQSDKGIQAAMKSLEDAKSKHGGDSDEYKKAERNLKTKLTRLANAIRNRDDNQDVIEERSEGKETKESKNKAEGQSKVNNRGTQKESSENPPTEESQAPKKNEISPAWQKAIEDDENLKDFQKQAATAKRRFGEDSEEYKSAMEDVEKAKSNAKVNSVAKIFKKHYNTAAVAPDGNEYIKNREERAANIHSSQDAQAIIKAIENKDADYLKKNLANFAQKRKGDEIVYLDDGGEREAFELITGLSLPKADKSLGDFKTEPIPGATEGLSPEQIKEMHISDREKQFYQKRVEKFIDDFCGNKPAASQEEEKPKEESASPSKEAKKKEKEVKPEPKEKKIETPVPAKKQAETKADNKGSESSGTTTAYADYLKREEARKKAEAEKKAKSDAERLEKLRQAQQGHMDRSRGLNNQSRQFEEKAMSKTDPAKSPAYQAISELAKPEKVDNESANAINKKLEAAFAEINKLQRELKQNNENRAISSEGTPEKLSPEEIQEKVGMIGHLRKGLRDIVANQKLGAGNFQFTRKFDDSGNLTDLHISSYRGANGNMEDVKPEEESHNEMSKGTTQQTGNSDTTKKDAEDITKKNKADATKQDTAEKSKKETSPNKKKSEQQEIDFGNRNRKVDAELDELEKLLKSGRT